MEKGVEDKWKLGGEKERWRHNGELGGEMEDKCGKTARGSHADAPWEPERAVQPVPSLVRLVGECLSAIKFSEVACRSLISAE